MNKICPRCNTANPAEANFCRHCRYKFRRYADYPQSLESYCFVSTSTLMEGNDNRIDTHAKKYCNQDVASSIGRIMFGLLNCNINHR